MRDQSATIDLGLIGPGQDDPAPWLRSRRHWAAGRALGWWPAALVTVVLVLTTTAAVPLGTWLVPHFTAPGGNQILVGERALYVVEGVRLHDSTLTAYRLGDGSVKWSVPLGRGDRELNWITVRGGVPLMITIDPDNPYPPAVTAFDPETGQERWTHEGDLYGHSVGAGLVLHRPGDLSGELVVVDTASGDLRQSIPVAGRHGTWGTTDDLAALVSLDSGGRLVRHDLATGARLTSDQPVTSSPDSVSLQVVGSTVLLWADQTVAADRPATVAAFDLDSLDRRWTTTLPARGTFWPCGSLICVGLGAAPRALDPATGAAVWSADWVVPDTDSFVELWQPAVSWLDRYVLLILRQRFIGSPASDGWLVDTDTGQPVLSLPGWEGTSATDDPVLVRYAQGKAWFARLRPDLSGVRVLGSVDAAESQCWITDHHLACRTGFRRAPEPGPVVEVWRLRG